MRLLQVISPCRISAMCEIGIEIDTEKYVQLTVSGPVTSRFET